MRLFTLEFSVHVSSRAVNRPYTAVPSTHHSYDPSVFIPCLKLFLQILSIVAFLFFIRIDSTDSPDCYRYFGAYPFFFTFQFFSLSTFLVVGSVRQIKLTYVSF